MAAKTTTIAINGGLNCKGGSVERERISSASPECGERYGEGAGEGTGEISPESGGGAANRMIFWYFMLKTKKEKSIITRKELKTELPVKGLT